MSEISDRLGVLYLSSVDNTPKDTAVVSGILFGADCRPMINLAISSKKFKKWINIIFLIDTGSPHIYLCEQAVNALGFGGNIPQTLDIVYRDTTFSASSSPKLSLNFQDINLIGSSFLKSALAKLVINYRSNEVTLLFKYASTTEEGLPVASTDFDSIIEF